jgi:hypothetical protein
MSDHSSSPAPSLFGRLRRGLQEFAEAADTSGLTYILERMAHLEARVTRLEGRAAAVPGEADPTDPSS